MLEKFLFCFKQKYAVVLFAVLSLIGGFVGLIFYTNQLCNNRKLFRAFYFMLAIAYIFISALLFASVIWEVSLFILLYEIIQSAVLIVVLLHSIIFITNSFALYGILVLITGVLGYWMACIHVYYNQLILKKNWAKINEFRLKNPNVPCIYSNKHVENLPT